ncbi:MAG TPA: SDR family oxidoreductase [Vicinamibacterales bacterium]|nr:SDR family oxidoreductase [Vicinamibacterales bacterium]
MNLVFVSSESALQNASEGVGAFVADMARARRVDAATVERDFFATARPSSLLKRFERPEEVASLIAYVCSGRASGTTGAALRVDGGVVRSIV